MKTFKIYILVATLLTVWGCSKDFEEIILDDFPFTLTEEHLQEININTRSRTEFQVTPEKVITTVKYYIQYDILEGKGYYYNGEETLQEGQPIEIDKFNLLYDYFPTTTGTHRIRVRVWDSNKNEQETLLIYNVSFSPFTFIANKGSDNFLINTNNAITLTVLQESVTAEDRFKVRYQIENGTGTISLNGTEYQPGADILIPSGVSNLLYLPTTLGLHKISFNATAPDGATATQVIEVNVIHQAFTLDVNAEANSVKRNTDLPINVNLNTQNPDSNVTYQITHSFSSDSQGSGILKAPSGTVVNAGEYNPIIPGSYKYQFQSPQVGRKKIYFDVRDSNGQVKRDSVIVTIENNDFTLTAIPSRPTEFVNTGVPVVLRIDEQPVGAGETYEGFYSSDKNSSITINGTTYTPGQRFNLVPGNNNIVYTGKEPGAHKVTFTATSGSNVTRTAETQLTFNQVDYTFTAGSQLTEISAGQSTSLNFNISESVGSSTYTMRYSINGNAELRNQAGNIVSAGQIYNVPTGNFNWSFTGTTAGTVTMTFFVRNTTGLEKSQTVTIRVNPKDFNFTATASVSQLFTGQAAEVFFNISEIGLGGDTYTMYYSAGGSTGSFTLGGSAYSPGQTFSVPVGSFTGSYTGTSEGAHFIAFIVRSSSGVEKQANITIDYIKYEERFSLNISQSGEDKYRDQPFTLTVVTNATNGHNPGTTYDMTFSFAGVNAGYIIYKGTIYREGETIPLDYGSTVMQFYPTTDDNFVINFRVENSTGISQTESESVTMFKKPIATVKGEKRNVSCGGFNGCDYEVRIYTCWSQDCSEAFNGATLQAVEIRIRNRKTGNTDQLNFLYSEARGTGPDRYFRLEREGRESNLRYLDQDFEVRVQDSNGQWSDWTPGTVIRV